MAVCCQNLLLGALSSRSTPSVLVGALFKKVWSFFEHTSCSLNYLNYVMHYYYISIPMLLTPFLETSGLQI
jgi:hypothetical protein